MHDFNYHKAPNIDEAVKVHQGADDGTYMAGGQTLLPTLKQRLASPSDIVDIAGVQDLGSINVSNEVSIGSMTTHASVASSSEVLGAIPALAHLAEGIGDPQVRNRGTIGGSVANNDPAADYPAACLALNATIKSDGETEEEWQSLLADQSEDHVERFVHSDEIRERRAILMKSLTVLNDREKSIILDRRLKEPPLTLEQLSEKHGISRERVRQIENKAIDRLKDKVVEYS